MTPSLESLGIDKLSVNEKFELIDAIADSISSEEFDFTLTDAQKAELDRRRAEHESDPSTAIPWEEVEARLIARYGS
jgi:putative addiction module component (TIGR02574 family)